MAALATHGVEGGAGFTLIELVVVIAVLAIVAAVTIPRYRDVSVGAHEAVVATAGQAYASAVRLVHLRWISAGASLSSLDDLPDFGDGTVDVSPSGWPTDTQGQNGIAGGAHGQCRRLWRGLLSTSYTVVDLRSPSCGSFPWPLGIVPPAGATSGPPPSGDFRARATAANQCTYTYLPHPNLGIVYDAANGQVTVDADASS